ncbi:MAG: DUF72 domain-containing protein [Chloroflexi bacterium]|nr:MAG: DUF72 domain-containing protein [Chloroflexota bacterium]
MTLFAGTSGFSYAEWVGDFYPPKTPAGRFLGEYAKRLNAVEINNTFQRLPREEALAKWIADTPAGFKLCLKAQRALTYSGIAFPKEEVARQFGARIEPLGERAGPVLLQFPPTQKRNPELLEGLLENLGRPAAVEFRDPGWLDPEVYSVVIRHGGAVVVTDQEDWPLAEAAGEFGYFRLRREYSDEELERWIRRLAEEAVRRDVYAFFRHSPQAPGRALRLLDAAG